MIFALMLALPAEACLWDYDTLRDEKRGMPGIAEVIAGQWERHSPFFYQHRVEAMKKRLDTSPGDVDAMDNLAVAYHKLGNTPAAIATMLDKEKRFPPSVHNLFQPRHLLHAERRFGSWDSIYPKSTGD